MAGGIAGASQYSEARCVGARCVPPGRGGIGCTLRLYKQPFAVDRKVRRRGTIRDIPSEV
jgi:hypothetical protein